MVVESEDNFESMYGMNFEILEQLKDIKLVTIRSPAKFLNCEEVQRKHPHVCFRYLYEEKFKCQNGKRTIEGRFKSEEIYHSNLDYCFQIIIMEMVQ